MGRSRFSSLKINKSLTSSPVKRGSVARIPRKERKGEKQNLLHLWEPFRFTSFLALLALLPATFPSFFSCFCSDASIFTTSSVEDVSEMCVVLGLCVIGLSSIGTVVGSSEKNGSDVSRSDGEVTVTQSDSRFLKIVSSAWVAAWFFASFLFFPAPMNSRPPTTHLNLKTFTAPFISTPISVNSGRTFGFCLDPISYNCL
ncbi:hypothetical protein PENTCL1PPCAC_4213, partial [Pristionchus entomophagus]